MNCPLDISSVICAYSLERWPLLLSAIESIQCQTMQPRETIVVCDYSPPLYAKLTGAMGASKDVRVVLNKGPRGLSGARNAGAAHARGSVIFFLDDDASALPDCLAHHLRYYEDTRVIAVGGAVEPAWQQSRPVWFPAEFDWVVGCTYQGLPQSAARIRNPIGANMSIRREVFDAVGGFRSGIGRQGTWPAGCEETELCIRAQQHWPDKICIYEPQARVRHFVPAQRASRWYFVKRCWAEGQSKARIANLVGSDQALSSERTHALRTLPGAIVRNSLESLRDLSPVGFSRAAMITAGIGITAAGYLFGAMQNRLFRSARRLGPVDAPAVAAN